MPARRTCPSTGFAKATRWPFTIAARARSFRGRTSCRSATGSSSNRSRPAAGRWRASAAATRPPQSDDDISRELVIQPDGTITLPLLGQVRATRRTVAVAPRRARRSVQKVLPHAVDHRDADPRQHAARRPAEHGRQPGRHPRRLAAAGRRDAGRDDPIAGRQRACSCKA